MEKYTKITSALESTKNAIADAVNAEVKILTDAKADADAKLAASKALNGLGKANTAVANAIKRIERALNGKPKADKKGAVSAATGAAKK